MKDSNSNEEELMIDDSTSAKSSIFEALHKTQYIKFASDLAECIEKTSQLVSIVINNGTDDHIWIGQPHHCNVKDDGTIVIKPNPSIRSLWNDSLFVGKNNRFEWENSLWDITFKLPDRKERCLIFLKNKRSFEIKIEDSRTYKWDLDSNPINWQFNTNSSIIEQPIENPNINKDHMIHEIGSWCQRDLVCQSSYYPAIYLWLRFYEANDSAAKTALREILHSTTLVMYKPFADFSLATQDFSREIFPYSPIANRANGEYHLWFCIEYSCMLQKQRMQYKNLNKTQKHELKKTTQRNQQTQIVRAARQFLKKIEVPDDYPTFKRLEKQGEDWRLYIKDLVFWGAISQYAKFTSDNTALEKACLKYLNAISHLNGQIGHNKGYKTLVL